MSLVKNNNKKGSRFNVRGRASYALTPKFKMYKAPVQRVKTFTTRTDCTASLGNWIRQVTYVYFGYSAPVEGVPAFDLATVVNPSGAIAKGALMFIEGTGLRIPRFLGGSSVGTGNQATKPLFSRLSDYANILNVNVRRTVYNQTSSRFQIRTFIFQNTGKASPVFSWELPFSGGGAAERPWGVAGVYDRYGLQFGGCPTVYTQLNCLSGIRANATNLFCDASGTRLSTLRSSAESTMSDLKLDPDLLDRKSDFYCDNAVVVMPRQELSFPVSIDGAAFLNQNIPVGARFDYLERHTSDAGPTTKIDHFSLKMNKRVEYEDDGENVTCKGGDLLVVHLVVPTFEPTPDRESGGAGLAPTNLMNIYSEIQVTTEVTVNFTDGT